MILFIDYNNKTVFVCPPKCGNTSIASYLNITLHHEYTNEEINNVLNDDKYVKLFVIRKNIFDRFLSGFYEDLFNNKCYDDLNITFDDYLNFLYDCYTNKIKNLNKIIINDNEYPIYFGNCSNLSLNLTDDEGNFISHIQLQKYTLQHFINLKNIKLIRIEDLNNYFKKDIIKNKKNYINDDSIVISNLKLSTIKFNSIIIKSNCLTKNEKNLINKIYENDILFIDELLKKYEYI